MDKRTNPFKNAGIALIIIGIIDIGVMIYCISHQLNYSSSFNIFAVIAGIFLMKGGLKTARTVRWLSAFFICAFLGMLFVFPVFIPIKLLITQIKLNPIEMLSSIVFTLCFIVILAWLHLQLSSEKSLEYFKQGGYKTSFPKSALYIAMGFMVISVALFSFLLNGEAALKAKTLAQKQLGANYKYHVNNINWSGSSGSAIVTAYNSNEIKSIQVEWKN